MSEEPTRVVIQSDARHIDDETMQALVEEIEGQGFAAQRSEEALFKAAWWVLALHATSDAAAVLVLADHVAGWASRWYKSRGGDPPRRVALYGPNGEVLKSVEVPDA
jgi:hypothetical protein